MVIQEAMDGLDTPEQQEAFVDSHQRFNHNWVDEFPWLDIKDSSMREMLEQVILNAAFVITSGETPGRDLRLPPLDGSILDQ